MAYAEGTLEHKKALQKSASIKIAIALVMIFGGIGIAVMGAGPTRDASNPLVMLGMIIRVAAVVPWFWGLADYCRSKGQSPLLALLGIIGCIGLIILVVLPDKYVVASSQGYDPNSNYPR